MLKAAGTKGRVDGQDSLTFLGGLLQLLRQSGYSGLVVVLDEVETIQRMNAQPREKSLNALRQFMDTLANDDLPGMYMVVTGTRDFYEGYKGLKSLPPLFQRVQVSFGDDPRWDNLRAGQVRLAPFTEDRLLTVARRVCDLYPATNGDRVAARVDERFLHALVSQVTSGFGGQVALAPRVFLRELVDVLDRVDQHEGYDPGVHYRLDVDDARLTAQELAARHGRPVPVDLGGLNGEEDDTEAPAEGESRPSPPPRSAPGGGGPSLAKGSAARRLDG